MSSTGNNIMIFTDPLLAADFILGEGKNMRTERIDSINKYIYAKKTVTLDQICEQFNISKSTLRRDLNTILSDGNIHKIYGGVTALPQQELISFHERNVNHLEEKKKIALAAAQLVEDGDIIFIDSGTTTVHIIDSLKWKKNITVITNSIPAVFSAIPCNNINVISLPGTLDRETLSLTDSYSARILSNFNISKAFMAATGFSVNNGVTNSSPLETEIKRAVTERSQKVFLLADSSKCGVVALITYCSLDKIDALITDAQPTEDVCNFMKNNNRQIILAT
jgi:DeoR family myo-inositol catabolism operon transcriptional repressor